MSMNFMIGFHWQLSLFGFQRFALVRAGSRCFGHVFFRIGSKRWPKTVRPTFRLRIVRAILA